jgi:hypothetical protein
MQAYIHEFAVPIFGLVMTFDELIDHQQHFVWPIAQFDTDILMPLRERVSWILISMGTLAKCGRISNFGAPWMQRRH